MLPSSNPASVADEPATDLGSGIAYHRTTGRLLSCNNFAYLTKGAEMVDQVVPRVRKMLPWWVGFVFGFAAGAAAVIAGVVVRRPGLIAIGAAAIISCLITMLAGAAATPTVSRNSFGAVVSRISQGVWIIVLLLFLAAVAVAILTW